MDSGTVCSGKGFGHMKHASSLHTSDGLLDESDLLLSERLVVAFVLGITAFIKVSSLSFVKLRCLGHPLSSNLFAMVLLPKRKSVALFSAKI